MPESSRIILADEVIGLELDRAACAVSLKRADGSIGFGPLFCHAQLMSASGKAYNPDSVLARGWRAEKVEIETPLGSFPGVRAILENAPGLPLRLIWEWALAGGEGALSRLLIENLAGENLSLKTFSPAAYRGADPGLTMGAGYLAWRFYRTGYQSWSPSGSVGVMDHESAPRFFLQSRVGLNPRTPASGNPGDKASDWMAQVVEAKLGLSTLMGFITSSNYLGRVEFEVKYDRFRRLEALCDGDGAQLAPGETAESEWCMVSLSREPLAQQARYYELWGRAMNARKAAPATGWCSWYFAFTRVNENTVKRNLREMDKISPVEIFQLDDGFEPWIGQWEKWSDKFPGKPQDLAAKIVKKGMRPGLWLAPFLVSRTSPLYRKHPSWVLRDERGLPIVAFLHPDWRGHVMHALDLTNPQVEDWLKDQIKTVVNDYGFTYLKLDFLYAAALPGKRHDPKMTGAQALRSGLEAIRAAAGDGTYILGCGCPLGPAIGIVDSMRVSPDIDIKWTRPAIDIMMGVPIGPGARNCLKGGLARLLMNGRLWANDPDAVVLRRERGGLTEAEVQSELTAYFLSGGAAFLSEDIPSIEPNRLEWFRRLLPPTGEAAIPLDLLSSDFPATLLLKKTGDSALVALFNWKDHARDLTLDISRLGLAGSWHVFDCWDEMPRGASSSRMSLGTVAPHGVKFLRLVRAGTGPRLLAHNLHLGMGEWFAGESAGEAGLSVKLDLPGSRKGSVWAVFEGGRVVRREVEFTDSIEIEIGKPAR